MSFAGHPSAFFCSTSDLPISSKAFHGSQHNPPCRVRSVRLPRTSCKAQKSEGDDNKKNTSLWDIIRTMLDFDSWAPRSSRAWRLGAISKNKNDLSSSGISDADVDVLNQRLGELGRAQRSGESLQESEEDVTIDVDALAAAATSAGATTGGKTFVESTDAELTNALNERISKMATATTTPSKAAAAAEDAIEEDEGSPQQEQEHLTGSKLRELILMKYGKAHDVSFVRRDIPGKTLVWFNIYHAYVGQRSFPMTEEDFSEKLDGVAMILENIGQAETVVSFLKEPVTPRRGLPSRPTVGNAVSVALDLSKEQISEWFGR